MAAMSIFGKNIQTTCAPEPHPFLKKIAKIFPVGLKTDLKWMGCIRENDVKVQIHESFEQGSYFSKDY